MNYDRKIFVIMPFSKTTNDHTETYWTNQFDYLLKATIGNFIDIPIERSKPVRTDILRDIVKNLIFSQIVLADITDLNANVLWELGVRQSFTNGTIVIAEKGTPIPFDISIKGILLYPKLNTDPKYHEELEKFKKDLKIAINDCLTNPELSDSHVLETLSGRGTIYEIIYKEESIRKLEALIDEFESNIDLFAQCLDLIQKNSKGQKEYDILAGRFRAHSIELLLVTRYLSEPRGFYLQLEVCFQDIEKFNIQLDLWHANRVSVEGYLSRNIPEAIQIYKNSLVEIRELRQKLENFV